MNIFWCFSVVVFLLKTVLSRKYVVDSNFLEPYKVNSEVNLFLIGEAEYLFVNAKMSFLQGTMLCKEYYRADIAFVRDFTLANLLAEALSETNLEMDSLWISAVQDRKSKKWWWIRGDKREPVDQTMVDNFTYNLEIQANDRNCLSFGRNNHDQPQFRPLVCRARRAVMCERPHNEFGNKNSTHPGWIKLGRRFYKIFQDYVTWETAIEKCYLHDPESLLAVVITFEEAQQLGRYLLIGRPSLENAWIGANWIDTHYAFDDEQIVLSNYSDSSNYPPWRNGRIQKHGGCILLDRHLANITFFVEAHCERERPYICYKVNENDTDGHTDIIIGNDGYRLLFHRRNWRKARNYCLEVYRNYSSRLVEIRRREQVYHLLYVMGENRTAVSHLWIGGRYNNTMDNDTTWIWDSDSTNIDTNSLLDWVRNDSWEYHIEKDFTCLTMDRENHVQALHYGAICRYEQNFVCYFSAENLRRLQEDESQQDQSVDLED